MGTEAHLRGDHVEELGRGRQAELGNVEQELAAHAEALVDLERGVHVRVVDEPLPANGRARLLEVDAHDDVQVLLGGVRVRLEQVRVLHRRGRVVHGARAEGAMSE